MKTKYIALYFLMGFLKPHPLLADTVSVSYENLKTLLESRNVKLEAHRLELEAAKLKEGSLNRSFLPQLEFHASQENFKKGSAASKTQPAYSVEAKVNLFNGGRDSIESEIRDLNTQKKSVQLMRITADELLVARTLFWEILYTQEKTALLESVNKINSQNSESALKRIRSGVATESDKMEFEIKAVNLKQDLELSKLELKALMDELRVMLNIDLTAILQLPKEIGHEHDFETNIKHSNEDHDVLAKEAEIQSDLNQLSSQKFKRNWWPKVDAVAGYNQFNELEEDYPDAEQRKESYVGLRVSLSLSDGFESTKESASQAKESVAFRKLAGYQRQQAHSHVKNEVAELKLLHSQIHDAEENIIRAEKYYRLTQSEYARGVKNSPDMLSASEKIFEVKDKRLKILKDFNLKQAHVLAKINK
jgi:outer membrane protein